MGSSESSTSRGVAAFHTIVVLHPDLDAHVCQREPQFHGIVEHDDLVDTCWLSALPSHALQSQCECQH